MKTLFFLLFLASSPQLLAEDAGLLIQFGLTDKETTVWDGSIKVAPGEVQDIARSGATPARTVGAGQPR